MAHYPDELLDHEADGIQEFDNPTPPWLMWIFYGSIIFSVLYLAFYALSFGPGMDAEYRAEVVDRRASTQEYFKTHPITPPTAEALLAGALDQATIAAGRARFVKTCASCHGENAQGLIGPNLTDDRWIHGGKVTEIFGTLVNGVPAKGMPPWGRAIRADEIAALVSYVRSIQGSAPAGSKPPEGERVEPEPLPGTKEQ